MKPRIQVRCLLVNLLFVSCIANTSKTEETKDVEPPFPELFDPLQAQQYRLHLVSESFDKLGYKSREEFADFETGKNLVLVKSKDDHEYYYADTLMDLMYAYQPFTCTAISLAEMASQGYEGYQGAKISLNLKDGDNYKLMDMHVFGVLAIWLNAGLSSKQYSATTITHSASKQAYKPAHRWSLSDSGTSGNTYHLYFTKVNSDPKDQRLALELIQIEKSDTKEILHTINILSLEYYKKEKYEDMFQVPVGYGCYNAQVTAKMEKSLPSLETRYFGPLRSRMNYRMEIEATATAYLDKGRISDTVNYELASSFTVGIGKLQLIRKRDSKQDTKTIFNYYLNNQYQIDMRRGTCEISNMGADEDDRSEKIILDFSNNLKLNMDSDMLREVFADTYGYYFIKRVSKGSENMGYVYFEKTTTTRIQGEGVRFVRIYSKELTAQYDDLKLESVTIYVFDSTFKNLKESYHMNILDAREISSTANLVKYFDVSEQCYLNNDRMKQNKDFAWIELTYPLESQFITAIASQADVLKLHIYHHCHSFLHEMNVFLAPRLELVFQDTGFVVRLLLIDTPPLQSLYNLVDNTVITVDEFKRNTQEIAVDLDHCADLCRLNQCKAMSFCESYHRCLLSTEEPDDNKNKLVRSSTCKTYVQPKKQLGKDFDAILRLNLHQVISLFQHQDYSPVELPKMPDELMYPVSQINLDEKSYYEIRKKYVDEIFNFLDKNADTLPPLTFKHKFGERWVILKPNKFELEQDPLNEFNVNQKDSLSDDQDKAPAFHEGLSLHRFKINAFSELDQQRSRLYSGFNYDQCALACIDGRCSSFSFCKHRQECIITDIYAITMQNGSSIVEEDPDCFIAQRDFLSKFNKFQDVYRPNFYKRSAEALNPSECAHTCVVETDYKCLAFDYCVPNQIEGRGSQLGTCFYLEERVLLKGADDTERPDVTGKLLPPGRESGCSHYSRSYLADFVRIEYRQVEDSELLKLKTNLIEGKSVDQCAEQCVNEFNDCTAFQFCFDPDSKTVMQSCTLIESKPEGDAADYQALVNETGDGKVVKAGKFFVPNRNCHVFSLRKDSSESHLRNLAVNGLTSEEDTDTGSNANSGGLSIGGGLMLYLCLTLVSAAVGCGLLIARNRNEYFRRKIDHIRILFRTV